MIEPEFVRKVQSWPTVAEVAEAYGLPESWIRTQIEKRRVRAMRLQVLRVDPDSWQAFLAESLSDVGTSMREREPVFTVLAPGEEPPVTPGASIPKPPVESLDQA